MWDTILTFITYFLAIFGAISLVSMGINSMQVFVRKEKTGVKLLLIVKDQEERVEGIIRNIHADEILRKAMADGGLVVVDMGSSDKTRDILERLKKDYEFIDVVPESEKENVFSAFSGQTG